MDVATITMPREAALKAYREYREHARTAQDHAIMTGYRQIAKGRALINAREAIAKAGFDIFGRPLLAFGRADQTHQEWLSRESFGEFTIQPKWRFDYEPGPSRGWKRFRAQTPLIPPAIRPGATQLRKYWILWEANWTAPPVDPLLLRHLSGDLYVVLAAWDLTDLERAAMGRV